jgi:hypothetical protein
MPYTSVVCFKQNVSVNYSKTMFHVEVAFYPDDIYGKQCLSVLNRLMVSTSVREY